MNYDINIPNTVFKGQIIDSITLTSDNQIVIRFQTCDHQLKIEDRADCCEVRYFVCDDSLQDFKSTVFAGLSVTGCNNIPSLNDVAHEIQFLNISTNLGNVQFCCHNEHNGWYGGFNLRYNIEKV